MKMKLLLVGMLLSLVLFRPPLAFAASPFDNLGNPFENFYNYILQVVQDINNRIDQLNAHPKIGPTGATGIQGEIGPIGPTGSIGATGLMGATGESSQIGPTGSTGVIDQETLDSLLSRLTSLEARVTQLETTPQPTPTSTPPLATLSEDEFNNSILDTNIWEFFSTNGGSYSFENGSIVVPGGSSMFYIRTKNNPFPITGPFTVEFGIQYINILDHGIGLGLGFQQQNGYDPNNVPVAYWQGSNYGLQVIRFGLTEAVIGNNPDLNYHIGKITYDGDRYQVYLDDVLKYTSPNSVTAKSLWFGNPACCTTDWTAFRLDYVKVY